jgi:ABC-type microcin C transport system duplicated ATPase subunit YejF
MGHVAGALARSLPLVRSIADHVVVMNQGTICERGSVDQRLQAPQDRYTRQLLAGVPKLTVAAGEA